MHLIEMRWERKRKPSYLERRVERRDRREVLVEPRFGNPGTAMLLHVLPLPLLEHLKLPPSIITIIEIVIVHRMKPVGFVLLVLLPAVIESITPIEGDPLEPRRIEPGHRCLILLGGRRGRARPGPGSGAGA